MVFAHNTKSGAAGTGQRKQPVERAQPANTLVPYYTDSADSEASVQKNHYKPDARPRSEAVCDALACSYEAVIARGNGVVWFAAFFAGGILAYFSLPFEPSAPALVGLCFVIAFIVWWSRTSPAFPLLLCLLAAFLGAGLIAGKAHMATGHQLLSETTTRVRGTIVRLEQRSAGRARITLDQVVLDDGSLDRELRRIRITAAATSGSLNPGDQVEMLARLGPPPEPAMAGARNMRRELFFAGIDATGFAYGRPNVLPASVLTESGEAGSASRFDALAALERLRISLARRYQLQAEGDSGVLVAALLVGHRDGLSAETRYALRAAGLSHVLAISGMHMALMTVSAMSLVYVILSLFPGLSASVSVARWSAALAFIIACAYLGLSGASTATQRAFIMIVITLLAVGLSRRAVTLRAVGWAALAVLILHPESLLGPSFQMSFAATIALVAVYSATVHSPMLWAARMRIFGWLPPGVAYGPLLIVGIACTSLIAGAATAPFAAYHFSHATPLALVGNVLALPLVSLIIMPAGLLVLLLTPFALEGLPLWVMAETLDLLVASAVWVAELDRAHVGVPAIKGSAIGLFVLAGCLGAFFVGWARFLAIVPLAAILATGLFQPTPILLVARDGSDVGVVVADGNGAMSIKHSTGEAGRFARDLWRQRLAVDTASGVESEAWQCDALGCVARLQKGGLISHVFLADAFREDCALATVIVSKLNIPDSCEAPIHIDAARLHERGAASVVVDDRSASGYAVEFAFDRRTRPWQAVP
ncbi:MAG: ComEC/Rec2 family competence protein [Pseudomonadota bacterium]